MEFISIVEARPDLTRIMLPFLPKDTEETK